jgi:branched-chain amino acid transport system substrate-binding protein
LIRLGLGAVACFAIAATASSCSLIVNSSADQCQAVADCNGFPGIRKCTDGVCAAPTAAVSCTADADCADYSNAKCAGGACVRSSCSVDDDCGPGGKCTSGQCGGGMTTGCTSSKECAGMGPYFVCRKTKCVSLVNDLCSTVHTTNKKNDADAYLDDNAVFFGSIMPTNGGADAPYGKLVEDSIKLAVDDFSKVNGIPALAGGGNRPLVLVGCNDGPNEDQTDAAAKHLVEDLGVPAIIGYPFSGNTIQVATDVTIPDKVVLFSPSATSNDITNLNDNDLVWRTAPRDDFQATALGLYYPAVEAAAKAKYPMITANQLKVAIVHHNDAYGSGLADALQKVLSFNGHPATDPANANFYKNIDYGSAMSPNLSKVTDIVGFAPHVIFLFGFNEGVDQIFTAVEKNWTVPADMHRPYWVLSDGGQVASLWAPHPNPIDMTKTDPADIGSEDLRTRVSGSVPGVNASSWPPYNNFLIHFNGSAYSSDGSADTIGPAGAYDIFYMLAYSAVMVGNNPLTGENIVKYGLRKMVPGQNIPKVQIDPSTISTTFPMLAGGNGIDIQGTSGPLDFDAKGDVKADIQIWCVPKGTGSNVGDPAISSGLYYDSASGKMAGMIGTACGL